MLVDLQVCWAYELANNFKTNLLREEWFMPQQCKHVQVKIICISTGYFCREDKCVKICLPEKNSGFDCLPNVTQIISDVSMCSEALPRLCFWQ